MEKEETGKCMEREKIIRTDGRTGIKGSTGGVLPDLKRVIGMCTRTG